MILSLRTVIAISSPIDLWNEKSMMRSWILDWSQLLPSSAFQMSLFMMSKWRNPLMKMLMHCSSISLCLRRWLRRVIELIVTFITLSVNVIFTAIKHAQIMFGESSSSSSNVYLRFFTMYFKAWSLYLHYKAINPRAVQSPKITPTVLSASLPDSVLMSSSDIWSYKEIPLSSSSLAWASS